DDGLSGNRGRQAPEPSLCLNQPAGALIREEPQTRDIYLARARYAEEQAACCATEEDRAVWLDSAGQYRALARNARKRRRVTGAKEPAAETAGAGTRRKAGSRRPGR